MDLSKMLGQASPGLTTVGGWLWLGEGLGVKAGQWSLAQPSHGCNVRVLVWGQQGTGLTQLPFQAGDWSSLDISCSRCKSPLNRDSEEGPFEPASRAHQPEMGTREGYRSRGSRRGESRGTVGSRCGTAWWSEGAEWASSKKLGCSEDPGIFIGAETECGPPGAGQTHRWDRESHLFPSFFKSCPHFCL